MNRNRPAASAPSAAGAPTAAIPSAGAVVRQDHAIVGLTPARALRETAAMECPINHEGRTPQYYGDYLGIEGLLQLQKPLSLREGKLIAHDEMLFIIIHQAYELWFKQVLHEITACREVLSQPQADDDGPDMNVVVHRLKRVVEIWKLLNQQVDVLETMTPLDFLEFRDLLHGASGFQSKQFREIEASLGLQMENRFRPDYYKHTEFGGFNEKDFAEISASEKEPSLLQLVENWLERMPFFEQEFWRDWETPPAESAAPERTAFWNRYRTLYEQSLSARDDKADLLGKFDDIFFKTGWGAFRPTALRAALFIMLYRDEPMFRLPFALLNSLIEIDEQLGNFRYRHLQMVRRMIGGRVGTGGSSGEQYLQGAVNRNQIFKELSGIITFLIERGHLPTLPSRLRQALRFSFSNR
ncbi:MAG: tryptophan 2,3-dioxygenase family protein [Chthoniobacterales bacterium]